MMISNNNNIVRMAYNSFTANNNAIEKTARALSTGQRVATAADDAASFAIGQGLSAQIAGVDRAIRNSQDGISMLQVAEGAMNQINSMLQRMRELTVQAANDTLTTQDRGYIQMEIGELRKDIDNVASNTTFNTKRLLDGSSTAIWSSDDANIKVKTTGAITNIDQFSQKKQTEGNYRIEVKARAGRGQVQKSAIFTMPKTNETQKIGGDLTTDYITEININDGLDVNGKTSGAGWNFSDGVLNITGNGNFSIVGNGTQTSNRISVQEGVNAQIRITDVNISPSQGAAFEVHGADVSLFLKGENVLTGGISERAGLEVQNIEGGREASITIDSYKGNGSEEGKLTATGSGCGAGIGGACHSSMNPADQGGGWTGSVGRIIINGGTIVANGSNNGAGIGGGGYYEDYDGVGAEVDITINGGNITATGGSTGAGIGSGGKARNDNSNVKRITINGGTINATGNGGAAAIGGGKGANSGLIKISDSAELNLSGWIDTANGATQSIGQGEGGILNDIIYTNDEITLEDIPQFYNYDGVFTVDRPQKITIIQGNGKTTDVTLYSKDTIEDVRSKLNDAIAFGLGQSEYVDNINEFVSFVYEGTEDPNGLESVAGTFVIRSAVSGNAGNLTFTSDNQDLINILGLNTIQEAQDNQFTVSIYDAHSGKTIVENLSTDGNSINGVLSPNLSIEFDSMANVKSHWNQETKSYVMKNEPQVYSTILHIQDRSTSFQIGQNLGEDIYINIGDMRTNALGLNEIDVSTRDKASHSITLIDAALHKVNSQRSKVGAYQNELEYNANSLTNTSLHLQESESRLKDADMAKEYMEFIKRQILNGTGSSMLAQANQNSQALMSILNA